MCVPLMLTLISAWTVLFQYDMVYLVMSLYDVCCFLKLDSFSSIGSNVFFGSFFFFLKQVLEVQSWFICKHINYAYLLHNVGLRFFGFHLLVILAIFCSYFGLIIWVSKLLAFSSADEELFSEMAIQDIKIGIDCFFSTCKSYCCLSTVPCKSRAMSGTSIV